MSPVAPTAYPQVTGLSHKAAPVGLVAASIAEGLMQLQLSRAKIAPGNPGDLALGQVDL